MSKEASALVAGWRPLLQPFLTSLTRCEQQEHAIRYMSGLLSPLKQKTTETIAYFFNQPRHGLQHFLGASGWDWSGLLAELLSQVEATLVEANGIVTLNLLGFPKKGTASVGVDRQSSGPSDVKENCQVAIYIGYASGQGSAVVDVRLYMPRSWTRDRARRRQCGVPPRLGYLSRAQLAVELLEGYGERLPHTWVVANAALGRMAELRQTLGHIGKRYLVAVPPTILVRSLEAGDARTAFIPAEELGASLAASIWSPSQSSPRMPEIATTSVLTQLTRRARQRETLVVVRRPHHSGPATDYYLSNAPANLPVEEWARVANAIPRSAEYLKRAMGETGLSSYEVRTWVGWHHHQALALVATWLLQRESQGFGQASIVESPPSHDLPPQPSERLTAPGRFPEEGCP